MTQPIQEPTTWRALAGSKWNYNQLYRRPAPTGLGDTHTWGAVSTFNVGYEHDGTDQWFDYYSVFLSDNSGGFFDFECDPGAGQFGDDRVFLTILQSGIYTFTTQLQTSDLPGGTPYDFTYQSRLCVIGGPEGTGPCAGAPDQFPFQSAGTPLLQDREQWRISDNTGDDVWINRSWTIPIDHPDPGNPYRTAEMKLMYSPSGGGDFWFASVWVVRHGDVSWTETDFDLANATWTTGDPCTT